MQTFVFYPEIHATPESDVLKVPGPPRTWPVGDTILGPKSLMATSGLIHWLYESLWGVVAAEGEEDACSVGALRCAADGVCSRAVFCREGGRAVGERLVGVGLWERDLDIQILSIKPGKQSRIVATSDGGQVTGREEGNGGDECRAGTLKVIKCGRDANDLSL